MTDHFYCHFENRYRGSRDLIKSRLRVYLPFVSPLLKGSKAATRRALDLGCGRGEWLELLRDEEFAAHGVDLDEVMLEACNQVGLTAEQGDALEYLHSLKAKSYAVVSGFHVAEHLPFNQLQELVKQALRVLKPGGILILETPNPENLVVGTNNFYLDPTHQRPLPPLLLSFVAEHTGFKRVKILRLQEDKEKLKTNELSLVDVLYGVSPDYAMVAQKDAPKEILNKLDAPFKKTYGIDLDQMAERYDQQIEDKMTNLKIDRNEEYLQLTNELATVHEQYAVAKALQEQLTQREKELQLERDTQHERNNQLLIELAVVKQQLDELQRHSDDLRGTLELHGQQHKNQVASMQAELDEKDKQLASKEELLVDLKEEPIAVRKQLDKLQLYSDTLQNELELHIQQHDEQVGTLQGELDGRNKQLTVKEKMLAGLTEELTVAKQQLDEIHQSNHYWWSEADRLNKELQTIYNSKSWRITWPLRKLMLFAKWLVRLPLRFAEIVYSFRIYGES